MCYRGRGGRSSGNSCGEIVSRDIFSIKRWWSMRSGVWVFIEWNYPKFVLFSWSHGRCSLSGSVRSVASLFWFRAPKRVVNRHLRGKPLRFRAKRHYRRYWLKEKEKGCNVRPDNLDNERRDLWVNRSNLVNFSQCIFWKVVDRRTYQVNKECIVWFRLIFINFPGKIYFSV